MYEINGLQVQGIIDWDLDAGDVVILRYVFDVIDQRVCRKPAWVGKQAYSHVDLQALLDNLPCLKIGLRALQKRFAGYQARGILLRTARKTVRVKNRKRIPYMDYYYRFAPGVAGKLFTLSRSRRREKR
jgi:hypothetical protein